MRLTFLTIVTLLLAVTLCGCKRAARPAPADEPRTELYFSDPAVQARLMRGTEKAGDTVWGLRRVVVRLDRPEPLPPTPLYVDLDFAVPDEIGIGVAVEDVTVIARVNGLEACRQTFRATGRTRLTCAVPVAALEQPSLMIEYESNRSFRDWSTGAEWALVLGSVRVEPYEATDEFHALQAKRAGNAEEESVREWAKYPQERGRRIRQIMDGLPAWNNTRYLGVRAGKNPADMWMIQQLLYEVRPDFVVATGAEEGGATLFYAQALDRLGTGGKVIATGDVDAPRAAAATAVWKSKVEFVSGAAAAKPVVEKIVARVAGGKTLVILGAGGAGRDPAAELKAYAPLVSAGSYLVAEDTERNRATASAVQAFLAGGGARDFEPDRRREAYLIGFHNGGWLRRK